ncbi:hypothetical protein EYF80_063052 [Liparis tanakae]|uniref:Uncharacterized protein n=1 Tax=Liparis tanakae TaxID=230148 RepID=A0A4Z2EDI7_9TELE|nr:hypothetical protein EYF80_063052 [Liparis tanakae]
MAVLDDFSMPAVNFCGNMCTMSACSVSRLLSSLFWLAERESGRLWRKRFIRLKPLGTSASDMVSRDSAEAKESLAACSASPDWVDWEWRGLRLWRHSGGRHHGEGTSTYTPKRRIIFVYRPMTVLSRVRAHARRWNVREIPFPKRVRGKYRVLTHVDQWISRTFP